MLKIELGRVGINCKVSLDGQDISRFVRSVDVHASVGDLTAATLEYSGAVVVDGEAGRVTLRQSRHLVQCSGCRALVAGELAEPHVIETTPISGDTEAHDLVKEP